jgi:hypothetical protein
MMLKSRGVQHLLAFLGGLAVALWLLEAGARLLELPTAPEPLRLVEQLSPDGRFHLRDRFGTGVVKQPVEGAPELLMGDYRPGSVFRFVYPSDPRGAFDEDRAVVYHVNSRGFNGPEFVVPKPPGLFRVVGVGDSVTFGEGVRQEDCFVARLPALLTEVRRGGRVETVNMGVSGYNTMDELRYFELRRDELQPDLVILTYHVNDAYDEDEFGPQRWLLQEPVVQMPSWWPLSRSRALSAALYQLNRHHKSEATRELYLSQYGADAELKQHDWSSSREALGRFAELSRREGFGLLVVIFPELYDLDDYPFASVHDQVREVTARLDLPCLDLLSVFRGMDDQALWVHVSDHHPNERAHELAAQAILGFLVDEHPELLGASPAVPAESQPVEPPAGEPRELPHIPRML